MQKNIYLEIEYLGTNYFGFQIQAKRPRSQKTVQGVLEQALKKLFRRKIRVSGSGRTDRGVHAIAQVVSFKVDTKIPLAKIKSGLNRFLPSDVRVKRAKRVSFDFHARFSAKSKIYRYLIYNQKEPSVFWKDFAWQVGEVLDLTQMQREAKKLIGRHDFVAFAKEAKKYKHCIREIKHISIKKRGKLIQIDIEAEGFLRCMARNIVSYLVNLSCRKATPANKPAPASGLYLYKVKY